MEANKGKKALISVIVPVYNILDCLPRCVDSICGQTYEELEILLVDDGSDDGTEKLVDELAEKDKRITVFHKKNGGSSSARNMGIREARGSYIGFVDSDDYIDSRMYEKLMSCILKNHVAIAQTSRDETDSMGEKLPDVCTPPKEAYVCASGEFMRELLLHRGDCSFCTKLTERKLFEKHCFPEGVLNEDFNLLVNILREIDGIAIIPEQYYHVYYRMGSNTRKESRHEFSRVYMDIVNNADMAEKVVGLNYPSLKKEAVRFSLYQRLDYLLHIPVEKMTKQDFFYGDVKKYLHKHIVHTLTNPYLTGKNKLYLLLLTLAPKTVRSIHNMKMKKYENI